MWEMVRAELVINSAKSPDQSLNAAFKLLYLGELYC